MVLDKTKIEKSLRKKGFVKEETHHTYFYHEIEGKRTGVYTYTSHGSSHKNYGDNLLAAMKKQLQLDTKKQLEDLVNCPLSQKAYNKILRKKGVLD